MVMTRYAKPDMGMCVKKRIPLHLNSTFSADCFWAAVDRVRLELLGGRGVEIGGVMIQKELWKPLFFSITVVFLFIFPTGLICE